MTQTVIHDECGAECENVQGPEAPDTDQMGDALIKWECSQCGEIGRVKITGVASPVPEEGFTFEP